METTYAQQTRTGTPTVLRGGARDWPAVTKWSLEYFKETLGEAQVGVTVSDTGVIRWGPDRTAADPRQQLYLSNVPLREAIEWIEESAHGGPKYYVNQQSLGEQLSALLPDLKFVLDTDKPHLNVWVGSAQNSIPLHFDWTDNTFVQVYGTKTFTLYDPKDTDFLYKYPDDSKIPHLSQVDLSRPDHAAFPNFQKAVPLEITLNAGDILLLPRLWWHYVVSNTISISVNHWLTAQ